MESQRIHALVLLLIPAGSGIRRYGPRGFTMVGSIALACGVAIVSRATVPWHVYLAFFFIGVGWACLSTTAFATTLSPWFEKYQGRAMSTASLGASVGGILGVPALLSGIARPGFPNATAIASALTMWM